ncbi:MAG: hypothetical protein KAS71_08880 [Bacteroidales bacterium]|nr:hypothetical protein [Bacteroidales bacterium]
MSKKENIDKIFRKKSLNFQKEPPPEIWENILAGIQPEKKRGLPVFWRVAAGIAIVVGMGLGYELIFNTEKIDNNFVSENEITKELEVEPQESLKTEVITEKDIDNEGLALESKDLLTASNDIEPVQVIINQETIVYLSEEKEEDQIELQKANEFTVSWNNSLTSLPLQIKPSPVSNDVIPGKQVNIQYTWDDLIAYEDLSEEKERDFSITALMSPSYSYRDIVSSRQYLSSYYNDYESGKIGYSGGIKIGYIASARLSLHTGLVYSRIGYSISGLSNIAWGMETALSSSFDGVYSSPQPQAIVNSIGEINNDQYYSQKVNSADQIGRADASMDFLNSGALQNSANQTVISDLTYNQIFHVMEIPFLMRYKIIDRKLDFNLLSGFSTNLMVSNRLFVREGSEKINIGETGSVNSINYTGNFGLGFEYDINKNILILFEPQFKYYLNSINKDNLIITRPYSMGFYTGLSYVF